MSEGTFSHVATHLLSMAENIILNTDIAHIVSLSWSKRKPSLVAQSDVRPTDDQEVVGSMPAGFGNILSWRFFIKYFL